MGTPQLNINALLTYQSSLKGIEAMNAARKNTERAIALSESMMNNPAYLKAAREQIKFFFPEQPREPNFPQEVVFASAGSVCKTLEPSRIGKCEPVEETTSFGPPPGSAGAPPESSNKLNARA